MSTNMDHWNGYHMLHHFDNNQRADQIRGSRGISRLLQTPPLGPQVHLEDDVFIDLTPSIFI